MLPIDNKWHKRLIENEIQADTEKRGCLKRLQVLTFEEKKYEILNW